MPPRTSNPTTSTTAVANGRSAPKGPRDQHRPKKEEPENEEPTGPVIRSQITNTNKASTGKSFLDAIRGGHAAKRAAAAAAAAPATPTKAATAIAEPAQPPAVEEPVVVEPEAPEEPTQVAEEPVPVAAPAPVAVPVAAPAPAEVEVEVEVRPHVPVTLPEADTRFSWASDEDYSFVNQYASTPQPDEPVAPSYRVQYPQSVIDIQQQTDNRFQFKAPEDHMTLDNVKDATQTERIQLENDRQNFETIRQKKESELRNKQAHIESLERRLSDQYRAFDQERANFKQEQEQAMAQARALAQNQSHYQQQQRQQQQQQSFAPPPVNSPHGLQQQAPGYPPSQDTASWSAPPQQDRWVDSTDVMAAAPPYDPNAGYYHNFNTQFPDHRGKGPFNRYGGGINHGGIAQQPHRGRGAMRPGPGFMGPAYNRRPMGIPRGEVLENGPNHVFQPRQHM